MAALWKWGGRKEGMMAEGFTAETSEERGGGVAGGGLR